MDLIQSTATRANPAQIKLALEVLGVKNVRVFNSLITAKHKGQEVHIRLCRENIPFVWWYDQETGEQHIGTSVRDAINALGVGGYVRPGTILTRAMKSLGLTNSRKTVLSQDFYVRGEYNTARERVRTTLDFRGLEASKTVLASWEDLKPALDLTGYVFKLNHYTETMCWISN